MTKLCVLVLINYNVNYLMYFFLPEQVSEPPRVASLLLLVRHGDYFNWTLTAEGKVCGRRQAKLTATALRTIPPVVRECDDGKG